MGSPNRTALLVALVLGVVIGVGVALLLGGDDGGGADQPESVATQSGDAPPAEEALAELPPVDEAIAPEDATDPETALRGFLGAEARGDWEDSYAFLTDAVTEALYRSPAAWVAAHAEFPNVVGYRIDEVTVDEEAGSATVDTLTGYEPALDSRGLVAARGLTSWVVVEVDDGTWRVDIQSSENRPLHPEPDAAAEQVVRDWVDARVACEDTAELEAALIGFPAQASLLCDEEQPDAVEVGPLGPLPDSGDTQALLAEFGPPVFTWARTARVDAATPIEVVIGPLGDAWRIVGVLPAR